MIDITKEKLLTLAEAAKILPGGNGKPLNYSTVRRWTITGQKGLILEFILVGNRKFTTTAALQRFCNALTRQELQAMKWVAELMRQGNEDLEERMRIVAAELNSP